MSAAESFINVIEQYFGEGMFMSVFFIALAFFYKKSNKKVRWCIIAAVIGVLCFLNPFSFKLISALGEQETYYRLLWLIPILLGAGYLCVQVLEAAEKKYQKIVIAGMLGVLIAVTGSATWMEFFQVPSNIYQMDDDVIQIADAIEELSPGERVYFLSNTYMEDFIRQYNANICLFMNGTHSINTMIMEGQTDYGGAHVRHTLAFLQPDYMAIKKESVDVVHLLKTSGIEIVAESDNYFLFGIKSDEIEQDNQYVASFIKEKITEINVEYVDLPRTNSEYEFLYAVNLFSSFDEQRAEEFITIAKEMNVDAMIINDEKASDKLSEEECIGYLETAGIPFVYNQSEKKVLNFMDMTIYVASNMNGMLAEAEQEFLKEQLELEKRVFLISDQLISSGLSDMTEEQSILVNYARGTEWKKEVTEEGVYGFAPSVEDLHVVTLVRVNGTEE